MSKYSINEKEYPGVTTVLGILSKGDALKQWAVNCAIDYIKENYEKCIGIHEVFDLFNFAKKEWKTARDEAMDIGSEVHGLIEQHIKDDRIKLPTKLRPEVENGFWAFKEWESKNIDKWIESEQTVCCDEYGYAGTLDAIAKLKDGKIYLIDFKASKGFYDEYAMQVSAYKYARMERQDIKIQGIGVLRLDKETGIPEWKDYTDKYDRSIMAFQKLIEFYYAQKKRRLKNNPFIYDTKTPA